MILNAVWFVLNVIAIGRAHIWVLLAVFHATSISVQIVIQPHAKSADCHPLLITIPARIGRNMPVRLTYEGNLSMLFQVKLRMHTAEEGGRRTSYITPGYRPDWKGDSKPEHNCAQVLMAQTKLTSGEDGGAFLQPLSPECWSTVVVGDALFCYEGFKEVGKAEVIAIYKEPACQYEDEVNVTPETGRVVG